MVEEAPRRRVRKPASGQTTAARGGRVAARRSGTQAEAAVREPDDQDAVDEVISDLDEPSELQRAPHAPVPPPASRRTKPAAAKTRRKRTVTTEREDADDMHTMDGHVAERAVRPRNPLIEVPDKAEAAEDPGSGEAKLQRRVLDPTQLYRGRARMALMRDLAMGEWTNETIAKSVGVHPEFIRDFAETYAEDIAEVRAALQGQVAIESGGLWISKRVNRLAELQGDYEDIDLVVEEMRKNWREKTETDANMTLGSRRHQALLRAKISILKAVSDELAPSKAKQDEDMDRNTVRYVIEQDDGDDIIEALT